MAGDKAMVARADGVGPKLAQRVVNELAEKIGALPISGAGNRATAVAGAGAVPGSVGADAMSALVNLGYGRAEAHAALQRARAAGVAEDDLSALIAAALQEMGQ
jgi:Holliday junction DNA helicase RuvA